MSNNMRAIWFSQGACLDMTHLMFDRDREWKAKQVCKSCPVITECRDYALYHRIEHGVWGGMTEAEREEFLMLGPPVEHSFEAALLIAFDKAMLELKYSIKLSF